MSVVKTLLGVRRTTATDLCLLELGLPTSKAYVQNIQRKFFKRITEARADVPDDPFMFVLNLCNEARTPCAKYLALVIAKNDIIASDLNETKRRVQQATAERSKIRMYCEINPGFEMNRIYSDRNVNELQRIKVTQLRLSSHNLAIGRERPVICVCAHVERCKPNLM